MRKNLTLMALLAATSLAPAAAQDIYRCGDAYSQQPCPGGSVVEAGDARSASQRSQASQAARRDAKLADSMEKARLKEEAKPVSAYIPPKQEAAARKVKPADFTAVVPRKPGGSQAKPKKKKPKAKEA